MKLDPKFSKFCKHTIDWTRKNTLNESSPCEEKVTALCYQSMPPQNNITSESDPQIKQESIQDLVAPSLTSP